MAVEWTRPRPWATAGAAGALLFLLATAAPAAPPEARPDARVEALPPEVTGNVAFLTGHLILSAKTDEERLRRLFRWVATHIAFDAEAFLDGQAAPAASPEAVLQRRKALGEGFADLLAAMGRRAHLEVIKVTGFVRGQPFIETGRLPERPNHAWNAVRLDGRWRLLDAAWGAGTVDAARRRFVPRLNEDYLLTPPDWLIDTHWPTDPDWQLLLRPVTREEFIARPLLYPAFHKAGLKVESAGSTLQVDDAASIRLLGQAPLAARLFSASVELPSLLVQVRPSADGQRVDLVTPSRGTFQLRLLVTESGSRVAGADFRVEAAQGTAIRFPVTSRFFADLGLELLTHTDGRFVATAPVAMRVRVPPGTLLRAEVRRDATPLDGFALVEPDAHDSIVRARFPIAGEYTLRLYAGESEALQRWAVDYTVIAQSDAVGGLYPRIYADMVTRGAALHAPLERTLKGGEPVAFRVTVPNAQQLIVANGAERTALTAEQQTWTGSVKLQPGPATLAAKFEDSEAFQVLAEFVAE